MSKTRRLLLEFDTDEVGRLAREKPSEKKALIKAFTDSSDIVRERALIAAIDAIDPTLVEDVIKIMEDTTVDVRIAAAQALAFYHQPKTIPDMLRGLKDTSPWVRSHCASGLSKILKGPIYARLTAESVDTMLDDFPDMEEEEINKFLASIEMRPESVNRFMKWRTKKFDLEIDVTSIIEEIEGAPILLSRDSTEVTDSIAVGGLSEDVETILSELPEEILATLPPEDLKRLTPKSARELVQKLKVSLPTKEKKKKKKAVKVTKVTKVKKKKKGPTRKSLIKKLPQEVRDSVSDETLSSLSVEELQALLASSAPDTEEIVEAEEPETVAEHDDPRMADFMEKYGEEKANLLITIPEAMLEGIPEEQIKEMDLETLDGLKQALEPR